MPGRGSPPVERHRADRAGTVTVLVCLGIVVWVWLSGEVGGALASGHWPRVGATATLGIVLRLPHRLADPASAWPASVRRDLPSGPLLDLVAAVLVLPVAYAPPPPTGSDGTRTSGGDGSLPARCAVGMVGSAPSGGGVMGTSG